jgi:transglutaminase-like putative cysteine protease
MAGIELNWTTEPPTQPGTYWFKREPNSRAVMRDVRETDGALTVTVQWSNQDQPVATLKDQWRGPMPPSSGPVSR